MEQNFGCGLLNFHCCSAAARLSLRTFGEDCHQLMVRLTFHIISVRDIFVVIESSSLHLMNNSCRLEYYSPVCILEPSGQFPAFCILVYCPYAPKRRMQRRQLFNIIFEKNFFQISDIFRTTILCPKPTFHSPFQDHMAIEINLIINNPVRRRSVISRVSSLEYANHITIQLVNIVRHILKITHIIIRYFYFKNHYCPV